MTDTVSVTTGLDEAAGAISGLLSDDLLASDTGPAQNPVPADEDENVPPHEAQDDEASDTSHETQPDEDAPKAADEEGEGDKEAAADEENSEDAEKPPTTVTVVIDGKPVTVPLEEAVKGYQRQADYTRKTQELSQQRQEFEQNVGRFAQEAQAVAQERAQYRELLSALHTRLKDLEPQEPNWAELFARDKNEYLIQRDNWRAIQEQKQAAEAELERLNSIEHARRSQTMQERVQRGMQRLVEWEPRWKDESARRQDFSSLAQYAKEKLGYTDDELKSADDPRALYAVWKAMQFDALQAKAANVRQQAQPKKPVMKAGSATNQVSPQARTKSNAVQRLVKNGGRVDDAAEIFASMDL